MRIKFIIAFLLFIFFPLSVEATERNNIQMEYLNIKEWHEKGYTGKGVKILLSDNGYVWEDYPEFEGKIKVINPGNYSQIPVNSHAMYSAQILHLIAPDAEIYVTQFPDMIEAIDNNYQMVASANMLPFDSLEKHERLNNNQFERAYKQGIFMNNAIGNYSHHHYNPWAKSPYWWSTGASILNEEGVNKASYSSESEYLKSTNLTNFDIKHFDRGKEYDVPYTGSSGATQAFNGIIALYYQYYKEKNGAFPTVDNVREFIISNSFDLGDEGLDENYGHGLLVLPNIVEETENIKPAKPVENNELAVRMINTENEVRYVHVDYVEEYLNERNYKLDNGGNTNEN